MSGDLRNNCEFRNDCSLYCANDTKCPWSADMHIAYLDLSVRAYNLCQKANINTISDLIENIDDLIGVKGCGKGMLAEIVNYRKESLRMLDTLGQKQPIAATPLREQLSPRVIHRLVVIGILQQSCKKESEINEFKETIRKAIKCGELRSGSYKGQKVRNFGKHAFVELCKWAGIDQDELKNTPKPRRVVRPRISKEIKQMIKKLTAFGYTVTK